MLCEDISGPAEDDGPSYADSYADREVEQIACRVHEHICRPGAGWQVGASIGICVAGAPLPTVDGLINAADAAMYRAKQLGKNRIELTMLSGARRAHEQLEPPPSHRGGEGAERAW